MNIKPLIRTWDLNEDKPYFERQWWGGYILNSRKQDEELDKTELITPDSYADLESMLNEMESDLNSPLKAYIFNNRGLIDIVIKTDDEVYRPVVIIGGYWAGGTFIEPTIDIFENQIYISQMGGLLYDVLELAKIFNFKQAVPKAY